MTTSSGQSRLAGARARMKANDRGRTSILGALFGSHADRFETLWPRTYVTGKTRLDALPAPFVTGDISSIAALSAVYRGRVDVAGANKKHQSMFRVDGAPFSFYVNGMTVSFPDIGPNVPPIQPWLRQFESEIGLPDGKLRLSAFATPGGKKGVPFHYDPTDNIIVQLRGTKCIRIADNPKVSHPISDYNPGYALTREDLLPLRGEPPPSGPLKPTLLVLKPGNVLFLPAGMWHATEHPEESFSLSLVFEWPRAADLVLERLRMELLQHHEWRRPVYGAWSRRAKIRGKAEALLSAALSGLPQHASRLRARDALIEVSGQAASELYTTSDTLFCRAPLMDWVFTRGAEKNGSWQVRIQSKTSPTHWVLESDERYVRLCRWIASQKGVFSVRSLVEGVGIGIGEARSALSPLTTVGAIRRVPFDPHS